MSLRHWDPVAIFAMAGFLLITVLTVSRPVLLLLAEESLSPSNLGGLVLYAFPVVGVLIALHRPGNLIAWLCLTIGLVWALEGAFWGGALYVVHHDLDSTLAGLLATVGDSFVMPGLFLTATLLLLLFPDGRLPSPRWSWLPRLSLVSVVGFYVLSLFNSEPLGWGRPAYENPLAIGEGGAYELAIFLAAMVGFFAVAASIVALLRRYRSSTGIERQQLKWLVAAAALAIIVWFTTILLVEAGAIGDGLAIIVSVWVFVLFPVSIGLAILRYSLYDIDRLINRTLVFGLLTAGLAATYVSLVVGLQALLRPISGGSDLAIVLTTLVVAALFLPARRRIQDAVDRRFNRRAYDAALTVNAFRARLREQIDLDTLRYELLAILDETMAPKSVSLWLRDRKAQS